MGTRALLEDGISPYSDEAAIRIQTSAYGRPALAGEHELRVAYPLYSVFLFAPFALIKDFDLARAVWMSVLEVGLVSLTFLSLSLYRWKPVPLILGVLLLFSIIWYHGMRPLINGNAVILVAVLITAGLLAMRAGSDALAGVLFAFSTIKPQVVLLLLVYIVIWSLVHRRWRVLGWLFGATILLAASAALIIPDWVAQNLREVIRYPAYNPPGTPGAAFAAWWPTIGQTLGWALTGAMALILAAEWWFARNSGERGFLWGAGLTLTASQWIGIQTDPGNFIVLLPFLVMALALIDKHLHGRGRVVIVLILLALLGGLWAIFLSTLEVGDQPVQSPVMFFPLPAVLFVLLYWVRRWAVKPSITGLEPVD